MCLIGFSWRHDARYPLVLAANRDEFLARPSAALAWWDDADGILGGRDLTAGGSWLAVSRDARLAAITNVREPQLARDPDAPSRGALVRRFVEAGSNDAYFAELAPRRSAFNGYNLLAASGLGGTNANLWFDSNRFAGSPRAIEPGVYGLSNGAFDEPWPKVVRVRRLIARLLLDRDSDDPAWLCSQLIDALHSEERAPDDKLPKTGVAHELERALSPLFVRMPAYGTRASSVVLLDAAGTLTFWERSFDGQGQAQLRKESFTLDASGAAGARP